MTAQLDATRAGEGLDATRKLVRQLFSDVTDKGGRPYAEHCERVEARLPPEATECERHAALLHDVLEDTPCSAFDLRFMGYSERTVTLVEALTRRPEHGTYIEYIRRIADSGDAGLIRIKLADNADNSDPERIAALPPDERGIVRRYSRARIELLVALASPSPESGYGEGRT